MLVRSLHACASHSYQLRSGNLVYNTRISLSLSLYIYIYKYRSEGFPWMGALCPPGRHSHSESPQRQPRRDLQGAVSINESTVKAHGTRRHAHGPACAKPRAEEVRGRTKQARKTSGGKRGRSRRGQGRRGGKERTSQQDGGGPKAAKAQRTHQTPQRAPQSTLPQEPRETPPTTKQGTQTTPAPLNRIFHPWA